METRVVTQLPVEPEKQIIIRVLIVDDLVILRQGLCALLKEEEGFEVVGEAGNEQAALSLARELRPDIVLVGISLETSKGLDAARLLLQRCQDTYVVLFAGSYDEQLLFDALRIGVHGYLPKTLSINDLRTALRNIQKGERVIGEISAMTQVVIEFKRLAEEHNRLDLGLDDIHIELIELAAQGWTNKEIGKRKFWSEIQVKRKMQEIYRKLGVSDRAQAVAEAMHRGLI